MFRLKNFILPALAVILMACGSSSTSSTSSTDSSGSSSDNNNLAATFPDDLAVSSLTASTSASASLNALTKFSAITPENFSDKKESIGNLMNFSDETKFKDELANMKNEINIFNSGPSAECYGPSLNYTDHPDATAGESNDGSLPGGDLGIWDATEDSGEACCASKMNNIMGNFETLLNAATKTVAATLGAASLDATLDALPDAGESVDMKTKANEVLDENSVPVDLTTATLERESSNTADGDPVYVTSVEGEMTLDNKTVDMTVTLEHIPMDDTNTSALVKGATITDETYCGTLTQKVSMTAAQVETLGNCQNDQGLPAADGVTRCTLVDYCKASETSMTYHLRTAEFCGTTAECGTVDPSDKRSASNLDGWANSFYYTLCTVNPSTGVGSCTQAWQAGHGDGHTRVLNVELVDANSGTCYFGYGPDIAATSGVGGITGMICNWAGPGQTMSKTEVEKAQRQTFSRNTTTGIFEADTNNITYAPTHACNKLSTNATFEYTGAGPGVAVTNDLINLADVDFTVPSLPVVPE